MKTRYISELIPPTVLHLNSLLVFLVTSLFICPLLRANNNIVSGNAILSIETMEILPGGKINNQGTMIIKKHLINQSSALDTLGTGSFEFSGSENQSITGLNLFQNLAINNSSGISIHGDTRINGTLNMLSGVVTLGSNDLVLGPLATIGGSPGSSSMIVPEGPGELRKEFASFPSVFTFPVGDTSGTHDYSPLTMNFSSGVAGVGNYAAVTLSNTKYPHDSIKGSYLKRFWNISGFHLSGFICSLNFKYVPGDVAGVESNISCFKVGPSWSGWLAFNRVNTGTHEMVVPGISSFSTFTGAMGYSGPLPPSTHVVQNYSVPSGQSLCFNAADTLIIAGCGTTFFVGNGGSAELIAGKKIVLKPGTKVDAGGHLYAHITLTNTFCTSPAKFAAAIQEPDSVKTTRFIAPDGIDIKLFPNPTSGKLNLELAGEIPAENFHLEIYSMQGNKIVSQTFSERHYIVSLNSLPTGIYIVRISSGSFIATSRIMKK
ncbi:MAG: T9SS type A sorting domain-containing protein [Bacteroidota bacterium]